MTASVLAATTNIAESMLSSLSPISLDALNAAAALQQRVDRKYVATSGELVELVGRLERRLAVLEIDDRRSFSYESTYFDTPHLRSYHDAARRRRKRFKVRTRSYLDTELTMLEIKTRLGRGATSKQRHPHRFEDRKRLGIETHPTIDTALNEPGLAARLEPALTTNYRRSTLVDLDDVVRVTVDAGLRCVDPTGRAVCLDDRFIVETKSAGAPSVIDRTLWSIGVRPATISKFGTGLAALHPELPSNKWHRTLQRHFA